MVSGDGFGVAAQQLRAHARNVEAVQDRFEAVKGASRHIVQNDAAYGLLCQWISGILQSRHVRQDELFAYVEENLRLAARGLRETADAYEDTDASAAGRIGSAFSSPVRPQ